METPVMLLSGATILMRLRAMQVRGAGIVMLGNTCLAGGAEPSILRSADMADAKVGVHIHNTSFSEEIVRKLLEYV